MLRQMCFCWIIQVLMSAFSTSISLSFHQDQVEVDLLLFQLSSVEQTVFLHYPARKQAEICTQGQQWSSILGLAEVYVCSKRFEIKVCTALDFILSHAHHLLEMPIQPVHSGQWVLANPVHSHSNIHQSLIMITTVWAPYTVQYPVWCPKNIQMTGIGLRTFYYIIKTWKDSVVHFTEENKYNEHAQTLGDVPLYKDLQKKLQLCLI